MLEPCISEIGAVVGSYSADHRVDNSVELPHVSCIAERKMNDCVRDEIWVTVPVTRGPRVFVRTVELSELCLLMCPSPRCGQLPAWAQFWVDKVMPLTLRLA